MKPEIKQFGDHLSEVVCSMLEKFSDALSISLAIIEDLLEENEGARERAKQFIEKLKAVK